MKKAPILIALLCSFSLHAQDFQPDSIAIKRHAINKINLSILSAWAGLNIVQGGIAASNAQNSDKYFHQTNVYWNVVNLAIAGYGFWQLRKELGRQYTLAENFEAQQKIEKLLLLNSGLDLAYMTTGMYLNERGKRLTDNQLKGVGNSLVMQGGFLLIFDIIQYAIHRNNGKALLKAFPGMQITPASQGLGLAVRF